ncbi:N-acetyltransferase [Butyrivibrio sp. X503]|uniref:GNAT family N-acetyltransferase n=1 Tax=Butyrivibrio sp. X503 TaxID=2364878 RepID=UPI000EA89EDD|nr:GNAT family protein [Butyrivibrio sp. X503]RKM54264.1 N-acetyltransferase [Butyrivibrio sp. X503]
MKKEMQGFDVCGNKVSIRKITPDDTELIVKWRNNERVRNNFVYKEIFTKEIHENWFKTKIMTGEVEQFIICENDKDYRPVGSVYFRDIDRKEGTAEYGIFIGEDDAVGKGYGSEIALMALSYAKEIGLKRVYLKAFTYNEIAIRSYSKAGFVKTKDLLQVECSDGQKSDMILMEKLL